MLVSLVVLIVLVRFGLPALLHGLGLHPEHEGRAFDLAGRRALIVATNHDRLGDTGKATGVASSELTAPYYAFQDAGMEVDLASVRGGRIPVDPQTLLWLIRAPQDDRALDDPVLQEKLASSKKVGALDFTSTTSSSWPAAGERPTTSATPTSSGSASPRRTPPARSLGGVCHGPLGLLRARAADGKPLVEGRRLTAVTDKQVRELGIDVTPQHPETELRRAGAQFESSTAFRDLFANHVVVDGNLVTGQNQNAGAETAQKMMALLEERS